MAATLLRDGRVLVAGGKDGSVILDSAEIYAPEAGSFGPTGSMKGARASHTATLLPDGRVVVAGGRNDSECLATVETYDPVPGTFTPSGP